MPNGTTDAHGCNSRAWLSSVANPPSVCSHDVFILQFLEVCIQSHQSEGIQPQTQAIALHGYMLLSAASQILHIAVSPEGNCVLTHISAHKHTYTQNVQVSKSWSSVQHWTYWAHWIWTAKAIADCLLTQDVHKDSYRIHCLCYQPQVRHWQVLL